MSDDYLSVAQVAALKGTSRSAVYKAVQEKRLPSECLLGVVAIKAEDARVWVPRSRREKGLSEATKEKISAAQRLRWQQRKQQEK